MIVFVVDEFEMVEGKIVALDDTLRGEESDEERVLPRDVFPRTTDEIRVLLS